MEEQRHLMAAALEVGFKAGFELHVYNFGGECFLQQAGGPTGKRPTCPVAKVRMNRWWRLVSKILLKCPFELKVKMVFIYIDDFRVGMTPIPFSSNTVLRLVSRPTLKS